MSSSVKRSIIKALGYRLFTIPFDSLILTPILMFSGLWLWTRALTISFTISAFLEMVHIGWYYGYERMWNRTSWGKYILPYTKEDYRHWLFFRYNKASNSYKWYWKMRMKLGI